jgi:hypothetical protein
MSIHKTVVVLAKSETVKDSFKSSEASSGYIIKLKITPSCFLRVCVVVKWLWKDRDKEIRSGVKKNTNRWKIYIHFKYIIIDISMLLKSIHVFRHD